MSVNFINRYLAKKFLSEGNLTDDVAMISISDTKNELEEMVYLSSFNTGNITFIKTPDSDEEFQYAQQIIEFVLENKNKHFVVHCFAGISRSAAVAKFINDILELNNRSLENYFPYNRTVYKTLMEEYAML